MSFDFNQISSFKPKVENTFFNKGGGGGNTGYFSQRRKKDEEEKNILGKANEGDSIGKFTLNSIPDMEEAQSLLDKVKGFLARIR